MSKEKIREVGDEIYDRIQHNHIINYDEMLSELHEYFDPDTNDTEYTWDYIRDKYGLMVCDLCGEFIFSGEPYEQTDSGIVCMACLNKTTQAGDVK